MTANLELFRSLSKTLDEVVLKVDGDLPGAEDIHPAIAKIGAYAADLIDLPVRLAKAKAKKASAEASVPVREKAVRQARHAVTMLEAKLKKLGERIDHNLYALSSEGDAPAPAPASVLGIKLPTRQEIVEELRKEIASAEDELAAAAAKAKKSESLLKGARTRAVNAADEVAAAEKAIADHAARLEETIKLLRKTTAHLRNRQEKRDRKRQGHAETVELVPEPAAVTAAPSDEDILAQAKACGLDIECPEDLAAARSLFI